MGQRDNEDCRLCTISKKNLDALLADEHFALEKPFKNEKKLVNTTRAQKRLADKEQPYTYLCPLRKIGIGLFFVFERQTKRRMSQTDFTTAELALHHRGLGAGPQTSKVQKVKRFPSLPVSELGIFLLHQKISILRLTWKGYAMSFDKVSCNSVYCDKNTDHGKYQMLILFNKLHI